MLFNIHLATMLYENLYRQTNTSCIIVIKSGTNFAKVNIPIKFFIVFCLKILFDTIILNTPI